jgi:hypothetical protein
MDLMAEQNQSRAREQAVMKNKAVPHHTERHFKA